MNIIKIKRKTPIGDGNVLYLYVRSLKTQIKRKTPIGDGNYIPSDR